MGEWIKLEDRQPPEEKGNEYLIIVEGGGMQVSEWVLDASEGWCFWWGDPTHWMHLPAGPTR